MVPRTGLDWVRFTLTAFRRWASVLFRLALLTAQGMTPESFSFETVACRKTRLVEPGWKSATALETRTEGLCRDGFSLAEVLWDNYNGQRRLW